MHGEKNLLQVFRDVNINNGNKLLIIKNNNNLIYKVLVSRVNLVAYS